jgi:hypothetical protein
MTVRRREEEEDGGDDEPCAVRARGVENAPLHSPQLTQRRTHPAVIHSTPAGEQQRPRIRRCHEEKTRGQADCIPTSSLIKRDGVSDIGHSTVRQPVITVRHAFGTVTLATTFGVRDQSGNPTLISQLRTRYVPPANGGKTSTCTALLSCCSRSSW